MIQSEIAPSPVDPSLQQSEVVRTAIDASGGSTAVSTKAHLATTAKGQWFIDSGASHHVSPDSSNLVDSTDYSGPVPGAERLWRGTRTAPVETRLHESPDVGSSSAVAGMNVDSSVGVDSTCQAPVSSPESNASHSSPTSLRSPTSMLNKSLQESRICLPDHNNDIVRSANVEPSCGNVPESSIARENLEVGNDQVAVEGGNTQARCKLVLIIIPC
ncbi:hypothetical protein V6N11_001906 [Hibiscus sabdariffa]|uniref:Uncharacterized protein n=1 Tax=Hibiscus sabdariffa TaxID=183260 RepID=A0ABR2QTS1_9ROSI